MIELGFGGLGRRKYKNNDRITIFVKAGCWTYMGSLYYSVYCVCLKSPIIKSYFNGIFIEIMENFKYICIYMYLKVYVYI